MGAPRGAVKPDLVATMSIPLARLGARAPISLTPDGAFQLAGVVRKTALLISSEDAFSWDRSSGSDERDMLNFLDAQEPRRGDFLLLGTGAALSFPSPSFRAEVDRRGLGLEVMDTGAACRTYNVLVAEGRVFSAALLPLANILVQPEASSHSLRRTLSSELASDKLY